MMYLAYGEEMMMKDARTLIAHLGAAMGGKHGELPRVKPLVVSAKDERPDREAFYRDQHLRKVIERR